MATNTNGGKAADDGKMALGMRNYLIMFIGFGLIVVGFMLMTGGNGTNAEFFDESMFSFRRITLAPILALGGFGVIAYGIMSKGARKEGGR